MKIYITLDYELYFGPECGTVKNCITGPTEALLKLTDPLGIKFNCFVDAGYLWALERQMDDYPALKQNYLEISDQIRFLANDGHGIELHIHPHWEDSYFNGKTWNFDTHRYKLSDFSENEVLDIVTRYNEALFRTSQKPAVAYRAGGWSAQPFEPIKKALEANNIYIDSTVYPQGYYDSPNQVFDFRSVAPYQNSYNFQDDLTTINAAGSFLEIPISSHPVGPFFYWKLAISKLFGGSKHHTYGDGYAIPMPRKEKIRLMSGSSYSVVSIDGYKTSFLQKSFKNYRKRTEDSGEFVIIGHPKAFTDYSLAQLKTFLENTHESHSYCVYGE